MVEASSNYQHFKALYSNPATTSLGLLDRKFYSLLISLSFAHKLDPSSTYLVTEEEIRQRELLKVEQRRQDERDRIKASRLSQRERMTHELHERVFVAIQNALRTPELLLRRGTIISDGSYELVNHLFSRAASLGKLERLAERLPWLERDLLRAVNLPPFADLDDPKRVKISTLRNAMGFVGTDDLKLLVPAFIIKNSLPKTIEPFNLLPGKLWEYALSSALVSQVLAELEGKLDPAVAFTLTLFHTIGDAALARLYTFLFETLRIELLNELRTEERSERYNSALELEPSEIFVRNFMLNFKNETAAKIFGALKTAFLPFAATYEDFARLPAHQYEGYTKYLYQGNRYGQYRLMLQENFATLQDGKLLCEEAQLTSSQLDVLRQIHLKRLRVSRGITAE